MSSINNNDYEYDDVEEGEIYPLDDMEDSLLEESIYERRNKRSKFKLLKNKKLIRIIFIIIIFCLIGYITLDIYNRDANYKLKKYVRYVEPANENDKYENWNNNTGNKNAYLIMFTSEGESVENYYMYTSTIVYRLLHKEGIKTKRNDVDVVVMVTEDVADWKLRGLHNLGAIIKRVNKIRMGTNYIINRRWRNCYTKLHMFEMTEYETIIYLDSDLLINKNIDELFDVANEVRNKTGRHDFFGAVTDGSIRRNYNNKERKGMMNAGLMVLTPEVAVYNDLIELAPKKDLYNAGFMEQGLLTYYYSDFDNKFNRTRYHLDARYNAQWLDDSNEEFYDKVYIIHQKLGNIEGAKGQRVQKAIFDSIVEWLSYDNNKEIDISYD